MHCAGFNDVFEEALLPGIRNVCYQPGLSQSVEYETLNLGVGGSTPPARRIIFLYFLVYICKLSTKCTESPEKLPGC